MTETTEKTVATTSTTTTASTAETVVERAANLSDEVLKVGRSRTAGRD